MENFKTSNIVLLGYLDQSIELGQLFEVLTIIPFDFTVGDKTFQIKRETVPYFGFENIIIGVRYKNKNRGIVRKGGHLSPVIGVDLQCFQKNINLKISTDKIQLTGAKSEEMGVSAIHLLLSHLEMCHANLSHLISLTKQVKNKTREWVLNTLIHDNSFREENVEDLLINPPLDVDLRTAMFLGMFSCEFESVVDYETKLNLILSYETLPFKEVPKLISYRICNGVYNYFLGKRISLVKTSTILHNLGYTVSYHNWSSGKKMHVLIPATTETTSPFSPLSQDNETPNFHRFMISQSGAVRQTSPTCFNEAFQAYERLMNDITHNVLNT